MNRDLFDEIFDVDIKPFIEEIDSNNSKIKCNNLNLCKQKLFREYSNLNRAFKDSIFNREDKDVLLDRHKVASCICGAFFR